jgi:hypothetical protein
MRLSSAFAALGVLALLAGPAEARKRRKTAQDPSTVGLGKSCKSDKSCHHAAQRCLRENDANGKQLQRGMCVLPCAPIDAGLKREQPPETDLKPSAPPRCPKRFECRTAGNGVPIDMCTRQ